MPHVSKKLLARNENLVQTKNRPRMNYECIGKTIQKNSDRKNIARRLPENSRNRFVDRQSKNRKKDRPKKFVFSLKADLLYFD